MTGQLLCRVNGGIGGAKHQWYPNAFIVKMRCTVAEEAVVPEFLPVIAADHDDGFWPGLVVQELHHFVDLAVDVEQTVSIPVVNGDAVLFQFVVSQEVIVVDVNGWGEPFKLMINRSYSSVNRSNFRFSNSGTDREYFQL